MQTLTEELTRDLCTNLVEKLNGSKSLPHEFSTDLNSLLTTRYNDGKGPYKYGERRVFKARHWLNRCDVEGARNIREAFTKLNFTPPDFVTSERGESIGGAAGVQADAAPGPTSHHDPTAPFEIYMGLGYTADVKKHVEYSCEDFLSIEPTDLGDAICLRKSVIVNGYDAFDTKPPRAPELAESHSVLYPKGWNAEGFAKGELMNDYAYILRDIKLLNQPRLGDTQVVFHVAGFTEYGTWAAGHFLRHQWKDLYRSYVQKQTAKGGRFVILLKGTSPFSEPENGKNPWEVVQVIKDEEERLLNDIWRSDLSELISKHKEAKLSNPIE